VLEQRVRVSPSKVESGSQRGAAVASDLANSPGVMVLFRVLSVTGL